MYCHHQIRPLNAAAICPCGLVSPTSHSDLVICVCPWPGFCRTPIPSGPPCRLAPTAVAIQSGAAAIPSVPQGESHWRLSLSLLSPLLPALFPRVTFTGQPACVMRGADRVARCLPVFTEDTLPTPPVSPTFQAPQHLARWL